MSSKPSDSASPVPKQRQLTKISWANLTINWQAGCTEPPPGSTGSGISGYGIHSF